MNVGCIGAGAGACAAVYVLANTTDAQLTVLEKSGGLCGRAATRRRGEVTYEYGANYVTADDGRVTDLVTDELDDDGLETIDEPIWVFDADGRVSEGRDDQDAKLVYRDGLTQLGKRLLSGTDAEVHRRTRVEALEYESGMWYAFDTGGTEWGPFDILICNPPAPQTAELLRKADWGNSLRHRLVEALDSVPFRTIWAAVLGYEFELDVPYYALVNPGKDHDVGWIAREECKPGHVPDGESVLLVQPSHEWSVDHYEADPEENVETLAQKTAAIVNDDRLKDPAWSDYQGWRYALAEGAVPKGPLSDAREYGVYFTGDWVDGEARVHAAVRDGLETGERIVHRHSG